MDSLRSWQAQLTAFQRKGDSLTSNLTPHQLQQITTFRANSDSLQEALSAQKKQVGVKLQQLNGKATQLKDSIHQALGQKIAGLRAKGQLSPKADSLWQKLHHSVAAKRLNGQLGSGATTEDLNRQLDKVKGTGSKLGETRNEIGQIDRLVGQLKHEGLAPEFTQGAGQKLSELKETMQEKEQLAAFNSRLAAFKTEVASVKTWLARQQQLQQWGQYADEIKTYGEQAGNMPETLEQRARELEEIKAFENQKDEFNPYQEQMEGLGKEDYAREQVVKKAKTMAKDHFAGQQEKLKAAQSKLTTLKQRMGKLGGGGLNGEKPKKQNPMKGKTLGKRLVLGGNFQLHPGEQVSLDVSPSLAYRCNKMFRVGLGGTYRTTFDEKEKFFLSDDNEVFGYRGFAEHEVYKGFYAHVEYERLKGSLGSAQNGTVGQSDGGAWQDGAMAGLGKTYKISNKIKGNVLLLYNFLFERGDTTSQSGPESLYRGPWNLRFGFELMGQGSKKQKDEKQKSKSNKEVKKMD